jgi:hypothetical protein
MKGCSFEIYKKKSLLSPLMIEAYSLSPKIEYHLDDKSCPSSNPEVFTPVPAAQEKPIEIFICSKKQDK